MDKALIVIDYTNDFVANDGALTAGEPAQDIDNAITHLIESFNEQKQFIVIANDIHKENDEYHPETKLFPPHNRKNTLGRNLYGNVGKLVAYIEGVNSMQNNMETALHYIDKTRYSAFAGTDLELRLRERGINEIHLVGVCTDICVLHTAVDAYNKGFKIVIHNSAVASFNHEGHAWAINHFITVLGAVVVE